MDFSNHEQQGNILINYDDDCSPVGIMDADQQITTLEDSGSVYDLIMLGNRLALGYELNWKCFRSEFVEAGYQKAQGKFPLALWDIGTGKKIVPLQDTHTGSLRGAKLIDENRLITWARDFRVFVWNIETGECLATHTTPVKQHQNGYAIVSSRNGEKYSTNQWIEYLEGKAAAGFNVTIHLKPAPDSQQYRLGPFTGHTGKNQNISRYEDGKIPMSRRKLMRQMRELEGVEAGYSTSFQLKDGRFCTGGTTYGAWEQVFIWDGMQDITILIPRRMNESSQIDGEIAPNTIRIGSRSESYTFENI